MEDKYTNREIDAHFGRQNEQLDRIEGQTVKTNGRVTWLEKVAYMLIGGLVVVGSSVFWLIIKTLK